MSPAPLLCFITPGHIATNPRLVKEAAAASAAGYRVRVVYSQYMPEHVAADRSILKDHPDWDAEHVDWLPQHSKIPGLRELSAVRQRLAERSFRIFPRAPFAARALWRVHDELVAAASRVSADLHVAHNLAALPVASAAAERSRARLAFDAEDFHRGELPSDRANAPARRLVEWIEERYIPRCDYVSAASDGIADAYAAALRIDRPTTIHNVCSMLDREHARARAIELQASAGTKSLYWFSQTIGPGRGLEDAVDALSHLGDGFVLHLRGRWAPGYEVTLRDRARARNVDDRLRWLPPVLPHELLPHSEPHDVGLALEQPTTTNRSICLTNKIFTYLAAGVPIVASATVAQRELARQLGSAVRLYEPGDAAGLAAGVRELIADSTARATARSLAAERFNWEIEQERFLNLVHKQIGPPRSTVHAGA